jgi:hypothetical protein
MNADGLRLAFKKINGQVLKQLAPDRGPFSVGELKINVGPLKKVFTQVLIQSGPKTPPGLDRETWAENEAFVAAGRIGDLIARDLDRMGVPAGRVALAAGVNDIFIKLAGRAEFFVRKTLEAVGSRRAGRGEST